MWWENPVRAAAEHSLRFSSFTRFTGTWSRLWVDHDLPMLPALVGPIRGSPFSSNCCQTARAHYGPDPFIIVFVQSVAHRIPPCVFLYRRLKARQHSLPLGSAMQDRKLGAAFCVFQPVFSLGDGQIEVMQGLSPVSLSSPGTRGHIVVWMRKGACAKRERLLIAPCSLLVPPGHKACQASFRQVVRLVKHADASYVSPLQLKADFFGHANRERPISAPGRCRHRSGPGSCLEERQR
jgi:hypothetical protein